MALKIEDMISPVVRSLPPSGIRKFFDLVANSHDIISLGVGEPDFATPHHIRQASITAINRGETSYTSNRGTLQLRTAIADYLSLQYGIGYDPEGEILITIGASEAVDLALRAVICPGDEIIVVEPSYVSYKPCTILAGGHPVSVFTKGEDSFKLTAQDLESAITPRTKLVILSYPNNPTGAIMTEEELRPIAEIIKKHNLLVLTDEIYSELTYGDKHASIASLPGMRERTILLSGFSKAFAMTGWRIGYVAAPAPLLDAMVKIHQYTILCAPIMAQEAALEGLKNGWQEVLKMTKEYDTRRKLVYRELMDMGLTSFEPKGAFYIFPSIEITGMNDDRFAELLLQEEKVAVVPGSAFGPSGQGHIRISYATSMENLMEAMQRMRFFVNKYRYSKIS